MQTQPQKLNKHIKNLLIGLYIGVQTYASNLIIIWLPSYIWFWLPSNSPIITSSTTIISVVVAYWTEETIRTSRYSKRTKIITACLVLAIMLAVGVGLWMYWEYKLAQSLR